MTRAPMRTGGPPPVVVENESGTSPYVLICEHASNHIPASYAGLGLAPLDLARHIAWDIGAADLARRLSRRLDAPLFLSGYSRLLIDCNRPLGSRTSIVTMSEDTEIPGNRNLDEVERGRRAAAYFTPFQDSISRHLDRRLAAGQPTIVVGVHSFTPTFRGVRRPWQVGVLYKEAALLGRRLIERLGADPAFKIGDNEPYRVTLEDDYTVPVHGDARHIPAILIEVRQDLLGEAESLDAWADRLAHVFDGTGGEVSRAEGRAG